MEAAEQEQLMFDDVAVYFTHEEWGSLEEWQKELYKEVMVENYHTLRSLGIPVVKSELLLLIEGGEEPCVQGQPRWEDLRHQPQAAPDGRSRRAAEEGSAVYGRIWRDQRPLTYGRRSVRKRCGRRSPNFSRVELECFVSLMDRYLPDELQRTGAISLRQRRSILQEIARCLEPMSGCLRTPRQLLHRWADFNNRDPERLMQIRMQLHFAGNDQSWESSDVETAPSMGKRWRRRTSRPLSSSSSSSCSSEEGEEPQEDPLGAVWDEGHSAPSPQYFPNSQMSVTTHIDAQGRYIVPPPPPDPGQRWWQRCSGEWVEEEQSDLQGSPVPVERSPKRATSTLYSSLQEDGDPVMEPDPETHAGAADPGLRTIKMEPDSEEDEGDTPGARCIKRSPNFSPAELECFVALMDHFLPGNLIRAGAIPIRQRKAILQEIARRLEPLSGCLRTPRQLRHRWTDFNNRDPDRLEEIRRRLRRAARQGSGRPPAKTMESPSTAGKSWRPRRSRPLPRAIKEEECPPEQMRLETSEEHRPRTPWHHHGLPKPRNSFSMARLKKNRHLALHILRMERLLRRVDKRQELLLEQADLSEDECAEMKPGQISM